jgi:hypothetical protein
MKKYKVLQLGLQLGFPVVMELATHGMYMELSVDEQVAIIVVDILCYI